MTEKVVVLFFPIFTLVDSVFHFLRAFSRVGLIGSIKMWERSRFSRLPLRKLCPSAFPSLDPVGTERFHVLLDCAVHRKIRYHGNIQRQVGTTNCTGRSLPLPCVATKRFRGPTSFLIQRHPQSPQ